jgi:hypothetical protein
MARLFDFGLRVSSGLATNREFHLPICYRDRMVEPIEHLRRLLLEIVALLTRGQEASRALRIEVATRDDQSLEAYLCSNDLWGGAGSIADEAIVSDAALRAQLESLLIRLGNLQLASQVANPRTESWVRAFQSWQELGLRPNRRNS